MSWWVIEVGFDGTHDQDAIASLLVQETGQTVEERADRIIGYAAAEAGAVAAARAVTARFGATLTVSIEPAPPADWTTRWRDGLTVRRIGRLLVGPSWLQDPGDLAIVIDPQMAFGSGEHGSTRGALALLDGHLTAGDTVLDLGSGSGILAIGAAKLGCARALGIEIDAEAIPVARANAELNGVADRVLFTEGDALLLAPLAAPVDLVVSNILRTVNRSLLEPIHRALKPGGLAIFSGMEQAEAALFRDPLHAAGFEQEDEIVDDNCWSIAARSR